jgi:hypothetical protein
MGGNRSGRGSSAFGLAPVCRAPNGPRSTQRLSRTIRTAAMISPTLPRIRKVRADGISAGALSEENRPAENPRRKEYGDTDHPENRRNGIGGRKQEDPKDRLHREGDQGRGQTESRPHAHALGIGVKAPARECFVLRRNSEAHSSLDAR